MSQESSGSESKPLARPWKAAFASAFLPGAGQMMAGARRRGWILIGVDLGLIALLAFKFHDPVAILTAAVEPGTLMMFMYANFALLMFRLWAADDAYRIARKSIDGETSKSGMGAAKIIALGAALRILLVAPHLVFGYYDMIHYNLLTTVFRTTTTQATTTTTVVDGPTTSTIPGETTITTPTTLVTGPAIWDGLERLNILLLGGDYGVGRTGLRTDTMITVSIDPESGDVAMFSVPRNWTYAPLPEGMGVWSCNCYPELMNELWVAGERYPNAFPGPGTPSENAVKGVNSAFLGIPIHYYALVNLDGFVDVIDAIGGIDIYIPERVVDNEYPHEDGTVERVVFEVGMQHLDGHHALAYGRTRRQDSDYGRMGRQRCVLEAALDQIEPLDVIVNYQKFTDVIKESMYTDIPIDALPQFVELLPKIKRDQIVSIAFIPPTYHLSYRPDDKPGRIPNIDLVHEHVQMILDDPLGAIEALGLQPLDDACGPPPPTTTTTTTAPTSTSTSGTSGVTSP